MDGTEKKQDKQKTQQVIKYIPSHVNNQAKCKWSKYGKQNVELVRLDKQVLCNYMQLTKK